MFYVRCCQVLQLVLRECFRFNHDLKVSKLFEMDSGSERFNVVASDQLPDERIEERGKVASYRQHAAINFCWLKPPKVTGSNCRQFHGCAPLTTR